MPARPDSTRDIKTLMSHMSLAVQWCSFGAGQVRSANIDGQVLQLHRRLALRYVVVVWDAELVRSREHVLRGDVAAPVGRGNFGQLKSIIKRRILGLR